MRTIQYSLASTKCMDEGWTVKPPTPPLETPNRDDEIFQIEVNSTLLQVTYNFFNLAHSKIIKNVFGVFFLNERKFATKWSI